MVQSLIYYFLSANIHAGLFILLLFVFLGITIFQIKYNKENKKTGIKFTFLHIIMLLVFGLFVCSRLDSPGSPDLQWILPTLFCVLLRDLTKSEKAEKKYIPRLMILASVLLCFHFYMVLYGLQFTGSTLDAKISQKIEKKHFGVLLKEFNKISDDSTEFKKGFLGESKISDLQKKYPTIIFKSRSYFALKNWHTFFTGLYKKVYMQNAVWYPGGTIKEALPNIKLIRVGTATRRPPVGVQRVPGAKKD